jgi:hypothetical protein
MGIIFRLQVPYAMMIGFEVYDDGFEIHLLLFSVEFVSLRHGED